MAATSALQPSFSATRIILLKGGSSGNSPHLLANASELPLVVHCPQRPQLVERLGHVLLRRGIHEIERGEVLDPERLEQQHHVRQVGALYLGDLVGQQVAMVRGLREDAVAVARPRAAGSTLPLIGVRLRDGRDLQSVHPDAWVVHLELAVPRSPPRTPPRPRSARSPRCWC